jgi:thiamine pyrophosphate-dependent acetolactate synthase large subunit-like protein
MRVSSGRAVVELLKAEGVRYVFGIVGSTFLGVLDALYDEVSVTYVNVRHEQAAAFMADGFARVSGAPSVCLVTGGPGAMNLLTGVGAAYAAHSPVVAIAGGPATSHYHKGAFQDFDLVRIFEPVTKASLHVGRADRLSEILRHAFRVALTGRRGPVFVDVPRDILNEESVDILPQESSSYRAPHALPPHPDAIRKAASLITRSERPLLVAGGGVVSAGASETMATLSSAHGIPIVTTYGHNDAAPNDHPLYIGPLGRAGAPEAAEACRRADLLLVLGSRLGHFTAYYDNRHIPPGVPIIQVDIEPADIGRYYPVAIGIQADAHEAVTALLEVLGPGDPSRRAQWNQEVETLRAKRRTRLDSEATLTSVPIKPQKVYAELRRVLPRDTVIVLDAGAAPAYGYDRVWCALPRTFLSPLNLGSLGFAFPAALGAKLARPEAPVLAIHGDGGFLMNAQEMETAVRHGIAVVVLVLNNNSWASEKAYQRYLYHERYIGVDIGNPRFDKYAEIFGAWGAYVDHPDQIGDVLKAALRSGKPSVVEIPIDPDEYPTPAFASHRP